MAPKRPAVRRASPDRQRGQRHVSMGPRRWWVWAAGAGALVIIAIVIVVASSGSGSDTAGSKAPVATKLGSPGSAIEAKRSLVDFPIVVYQGQQLLGSEQPSLYSLFRAKPVVLNYWASNCAPCYAEIPEFEKVWRRYQDRVLFLGLDVGRFFPGFGGSDRSKGELKELGVTYPAGTPPNVQTVFDLQVRALPTTVFLTPEGKVLRTWAGGLNETRLASLVEELLRGSPSKEPELGRAVPTLSPGHGPPYTYNTQPPTSGRHLSTPAPYGFSAGPLAPEAVVHNMEHGGVVVWYRPDDAALRDQVRSLVSQLAKSGCLVATPYSGLNYDVVVTVWGRLLELSAFDAGAVRAFYDGYAGAQGPEKGACWAESAQR